MYRFAWAVLVTDALLDELRGLANDTSASDEVLRDAVAGVLRHVGGLPVVEAPVPESQRTAWARRLLREALAHLLRDAGRQTDSDDGYVPVSTAGIPADQVIRGLARVGINTEPVPRLRAAGLGPTVATRVVSERRRRGRITSLSDLDERVRGVGPATIDEIAHAVHFDPPRAEIRDGFTDPSAPLDDTAFAQDFAYLVTQQPGDDPRARLTAALDTLATTVATEPHPATRQRRRRHTSVTVPDGAETTADWIGVLFGSSYYARVADFFDDATSTIDVCMFHVALPSASHPTQRLLDALVRAHQRGVTVRVLLDQDRETDPYRSTVINSPARSFLASSGVSVRFDVSDALLHSKFLVIDQELAVVGSHNWSAGSYFHFDDLTLVVGSTPLATELHTRFDGLWAQGS